MIPLHTRRAFTLIELAGVMVILGALSLTAIPAMNGMGAASERADRDAVVAALESARDLAAASGVRHAVAFDLAQNTVQVVRLWKDQAVPADDPFGGETAPVTVREDPVASLSAETTDSIAGVHIWFAPPGEPLGTLDLGGSDTPMASTLTVVFGSGQSVVIHPQSGTVTR